MSEDYLYLFLCYLVYGLTLVVLTTRSKNKLKTLMLNLTISAIYSGLFFYKLAYDSSSGSGLLWLFYLLFSIGIHWIVNLIGILLTYIKPKSK